MVTDPRTFGDNTTALFNVLQASADLGIKRVISASSNQLYGFAGAPPVFVPVTEDHPARPINSYALSKLVGEQTAEYFNRTRGMEVLSFRIMGTRAPDELPEETAAMKDDAAGTELQAAGQLLEEGCVSSDATANAAVSVTIRSTHSHDRPRRLC